MTYPEKPFSGAYPNVLALFDEVVEKCGDIEAFVCGDERMTFAQWAQRADGVATYLSAQGVRAGDVVGISLPSSLDYAIAYQAIIRCGAIASGMNPRLGVGETTHILQKSEPVCVVTDTTSGAFADDGQFANVRRIGLSELQNAFYEKPFTARPKMDLDDIMALVWTSGTTGKPKGAMFDHGCLYAMSKAAGPLSAVGDRRLSPLPFAHVGYMTRIWDELAHVITTIVCPTPWTAAETLALIENERVTVGQGVPAQWQMMLAHPNLASTDVSSLRIVSSGAARIPPEMVEGMRDQFHCPVVVRYTSTEACVSTGTALSDSDEVICTTVGKPGPGVEMELRLDEGRGRQCETGEVGTVCLRSRAMMRGYWREPELTAAAIDENGWLLTGDLGHLEDDGNLRLDGRSTEMYIRGGYNVYPIEIENCLGQHPNIDRVAVVGTPAPVLGEIGVAFIVPTGDEPTLEELRAWCQKELASYKAPDALVIIDELPLTAMSKIDKRALAPLAAEAEKKWER